MPAVIAEPPQILTTEQAAKLLGVRPQTLMNWRSTRRQRVPFIRVGRAVRYRRADVEAWLTKRTEDADSIEEED
jgi:excisionase family DNA binding protein